MVINGKNIESVNVILDKYCNLKGCCGLFYFKIDCVRSLVEAKISLFAKQCGLSG